MYKSLRYLGKDLVKLFIHHLCGLFVDGNLLRDLLNFLLHLVKLFSVLLLLLVKADLLILHDLGKVILHVGDKALPIAFSLVCSGLIGEGGHYQSFKLS